MDPLINPAGAQAMANMTNQWADLAVMNQRNGNIQYNNGYKAGHASMKKAAVEHVNKILKEMAQIEDERDVAQADLAANLFSSREKGKLLAGAYGQEWYDKWEKLEHLPAKNKIYSDSLIAKGYKMD
mgnify:CR=1 FL=1